MYVFNLPLEIIMLILQYADSLRKAAALLFDMDKRTLRHCGVITSIDGNRIRVRCARLSACDTCSAVESCRQTRGKSFDVDVTDSNAATRSIGERVTIETSAGNGRYAVLLGFVLPLAAFAATLLLARGNGLSDVMSAAFSLTVCVVYYALLFLFRKALDKRFVFRIADTDISK